MKQAKSTSQIHVEMITLFLLLKLLSSVSSFTSPRIIYGGWTPILPGHPFFFGTARSKNYEQLQYRDKTPYGRNSPKTISIYNSYPSSLFNQQEHEEKGTEYRNYRDYGHHNSHSDIYHHHESKYEDYPKKAHKNLDSHKHSKNIYSYYPPQSSLDGPPRPGKLGYKPVYLEIPRKPLDVLENPHKFVPYILPSIRDLLPKDLKVVNNGGEQTYLKVTPLGNVDSHSIAPIGHINLDKIQYIPNLSSDGKYKSGHDSTAALRNYDSALYPPLSHSLRHHDETKFHFEGHNHLQSKEPHKAYESMNNFKDTVFSQSDDARNPKGNDFASMKSKHIVSYRPEHDIKSSKGRPLTYYVAGDNYKNKMFSSNPSHVQMYPSNTESHHDTKYISPQLSYSHINKDLYSSGTLNKDTMSQVRNFLGSNSKYYPPSSKSYYTINGQKPFLAPGSYNFNQYANKPYSIVPLKAMRNSFTPKSFNRYVPKNLEVGKVYRDPSILTNIRGTPAVVEREVSIVHLPVETTPTRYLRDDKSYSDDDEVLYLKASSPLPQSTEFRNFRNRNGTRDYAPENLHSAGFILNETYVDHPLEFHILEDDERKLHSEIVTSEENDRNSEQSVFVGTRGLDSRDVQSVSDVSEESKFGSEHFPKETTNKKQFFHAYYAPSDHSPPKGYLKMSIDEFHKLFKDAEIQYIQRKQSDILHSQKRAD